MDRMVGILVVVGHVLTLPSRVTPSSWTRCISTNTTKMQNQRTFKLIPPPQSRSESPERPVRPMTSKQVRKAYKASTREAPISRAERHRQEKAEQERIRKEFEREKAAAKVKLARDKKKDKELAEKQEKRRQGKPLVTVRPSQDTIARFVRGNGSLRKRDSSGSAVADLAQCVQENVPSWKPPVSPVKEDTEAEPDWIPDDSLDEILGDVSVIHEVPASTQAILGNLDDFFPSSSQQRRELQDSTEQGPQEAEDAVKEQGPQHELQDTAKDERLQQESGDIREEEGPQQELEDEREDEETSPQEPKDTAKGERQQQELENTREEEKPKEIEDAAKDKRLQQESGDTREEVKSKAIDTAKEEAPRFFTPSGSHELLSLAKRRSQRSKNLADLHERDHLQAQLATLQKQHDKENQHPCSQESYGGDWVDDLAGDLIL